MDTRVIIPDNEPELTPAEKAAREDECQLAPNVVVAVNFYDKLGQTSKKTALGIIVEGPLENERSHRVSFTVRLIYPLALAQGNLVIGQKESDLMALYKRPEGHEGDIDERELLGAMLILARRLDKRDNNVASLRNQISRHGGTPCC
jgi:hypothetical protein